MQSEFPSILLGVGSPTPVTPQWKSEDILSNLTFASHGNATTVGEMEMPGNRRTQYGQFSPSTSVFLAVLMTLLVFATVLGNALVILAFIVEKGLRTQGNFFFLNLAIADFLVGGFCIPVYIPYVLTGEWRLGRGLCKLWLVVDYTLCTASVFNIVLISFDRFLSVTRAVSYRCQKGVNRGAVMKMLSVWMAAFLLYGPAIISWEYATGSSVVPDLECHAEFYFNWYFLMTASTFEFFTPFVTVTYLNVSIYMNIRRRKLMRDETPADTVVAGGSCEMEELGLAGGGRGGGLQQVFFVRSLEAEGRRNHTRLVRAKPRNFTLPSAKVSVVRGNSSLGRGKDSTLLDLPPLQMAEMVVQHPSENAFHPQRSRSDVAASRFRLSRDKKVAKSLAVIVCVFGLCWAPYTLLMIIRAACHAQCVQHYLYEISFWLLWINSSINPILYPLCHTSFRRAFSKLLCPTKVKIQPQYMEQKY
ncbi:histamine H3 receptor [Osmerus mordax]|uniref:histamine H3 receptor n=1 Tax=Osmerus mordax TaxID=8014 RepID=UPI00350F40FC